ncbi:MAG: hypothetical protein HYY50_04295 [Candidatus Kerfeldbacteria bacterium]|nr:hypothetical protein [Candidatus Kerfeldbacteria bacterium]
MRLIHRYRRRLFHPGELELGLLTAVAVGWPKVVVFIPLGLLLVVMFSVFRLVVMKQPYTSLAEPLLLSALITMFLGDPLVTMLDLGTLRV